MLVSTKLAAGASLGGGQEPAVELQSEGGRAGRRATARLAPGLQASGLARGLALYGREHGGIARSSSERCIIVKE